MSLQSYTMNKKQNYWYINNKKHKRFLLVGLETVQIWSVSHVMLTEIDVLVGMKQLSKSV